MKRMPEGRLQARPRLKASAIASAIAMALSSMAAQSQESVIVSSGSKPMFELDFYNDHAAATSTIPSWGLDEAQKQGIVLGASYMAEVLAPGSRNQLHQGSGAVPLTIILHSEDGSDDNAAAESSLYSPIDTQNGAYTRFQKAIIDGVWSQVDFSDSANALSEDGEPLDSSHTSAEYYPVGLYIINQSDSRSAAPYLYPVPTLSSPAELTSVSMHEMLHAMGISCGAQVSAGSPYATAWDYTRFAAHLVSYAVGENGTPGSASYRVNQKSSDGRKLAYNDHVSRPSDTYAGDDNFLVGSGAQSGVYFEGANVSEVLKGALPGVPVNGYEGSGASLDFDLSHLELAHSMMSHQNWRNYTTLMEAEYAVLQDIGYDIDRRNLFGGSEYRSNQIYTNASPYYARNAERSAYLQGVPNLMPLGVGFHLYGSLDKITQGADLLADGEGGVGIRNDGSSNVITIPKGVRVTANGTRGSGVLFAYGTNNRLVVDGAVEAQGAGGKALNFDFGTNLIDEEGESRGSYIHTGENGQDLPLSGKDPDSGYALDLDGALMRSVAISGSVRGSAAAIYMSGNALVRSIGILKGASLEGDIVSLWDPDLPKVQRDQANGHSLYTTLTFGALLDDELVPREDAGDPAFSMSYAGNIHGSSSIRMKVAAGRLETSGSIDVKSLDNYGTLALSQVAYGNRVSAGEFSNHAGANLVTELMEDGSISTIEVSSSASLDGTWTVRPHAEGYIRNGQSIALKAQSPIEGAGSVSGSFASYAMETGSKTLKGTFDGNTATFTRDKDAYSSKTSDDEKKDVAKGIDGAAGDAQGGMRDLVAALDFLPEGISYDKAMAALSPEVYNSSSSIALRDASRSSRTLSSLLKASSLHGPVTGTGALGSAYLTAGPADGRIGFSDKVFFIEPYGEIHKQDGRRNSPDLDSYSGGIIAGVSFVRDDGLVWGVNGGASVRHTLASGDLHSDSIKSAGAFLGVHAFLAPPEWGGTYATLLAKAGLYENRSKRHVDLPGFNATSKADYGSVSWNVFAEAGHDFKWGAAAFGPMASLEYAADSHGSFKEHGSGSVDLKVHSDTADSLKLSLGMHHLHRIAALGGYALKGDLSVRYARELLETDFSTRSSFRSGNGYEFTTSTESSSRNMGVAGYELTASSGMRTFSLSAEYELGDRNSAFSLGAYFNARF